jgi:hypothetical protein
LMALQTLWHLWAGPLGAVKSMMLAAAVGWWLLTRRLGQRQSLLRWQANMLHSWQPVRQHIMVRSVCAVLRRHLAYRFQLRVLGVAVAICASVCD